MPVMTPNVASGTIESRNLYGRRVYLCIVSITGRIRASAVKSLSLLVLRNESSFTHSFHLKVQAKTAGRIPTILRSIMITMMTDISDMNSIISVSSFCLVTHVLE